MPCKKKSTPLKYRRCQRQGHLVKACPISRRRKERQAILARPLLETVVSLALPLEAFISEPTWEEQIEQDLQQTLMDWNRPNYELQCEEDWDNFPEQAETSNWDEPIQEPPQQGSP